MPLLDHFHPPLSDERNWEGFHGEWAGMIVHRLNEGILPEKYFAEPRIHWGSRVEIDVATLDRRPVESSGGAATAVWAPTRPTLSLTVDGMDPDVVEVRVLRRRGGPRLVAAIELVSPSNKDRPSSRRAFAAQCAGYLQAGVGLVIVDVVTDRSGNLHEELLSLMRPESELHRETGLSNHSNYAVSYLGVPQGESSLRLDVWSQVLEIGAPLPELPLWLSPDICVPLDLEASYLSTCRALRIEGE